jgi:hypothetical protein
MARVVEFNAFRQESLAATLPPARQRGTATFCLHARTKSVLAFACALRWLISPFHKAKITSAGFESGYTRNARDIVNPAPQMLIDIDPLLFQDCQRRKFLK